MKRFAGYKEEAIKPSTQLPVGSYIVKIVNAKFIDGINGASDRIDLQIDVAEGEQENFFMKQYNESTSEDKKFKGRGSIFYPKGDGSKDDAKTVRSFNAFTKYLADENPGFHMDFDKGVEQFKGKKIGATFREEWNKDDNGREYSYTSFAWFCDPQDVRNGKAKPAQTKFRNGATGKVYSEGSLPSGENAGFINIDPSVEAEEIPFK